MALNYGPLVSEAGINWLCMTVIMRDNSRCSFWEVRKWCYMRPELKRAAGYAFVLFVSSLTTKIMFLKEN